MKNSSKNNYSEKNNKYKNSPDSKINSKKINSSKKNNRFPLKSTKNNGVNNFNSVNKNNFSTLKTRKPTYKSNLEAFNKGQDIYQEHSNKKNFDDWIWGKHSVFEALTSERPINRIWCTTEIFSSEKFYILLKNLKSKGVLVEEVSWSRLSQLTFNASVSYTHLTLPTKA